VKLQVGRPRSSTTISVEDDVNVEPKQIDNDNDNNDNDNNDMKVDDDSNNNEYHTPKDKDGKNDVTDDSKGKIDDSICLLFAAYAGVNQTQLWEQWYTSASANERNRIHVVWWMDKATDEKYSPTTVNISQSSTDARDIESNRMFRNDNRLKSDTRTFRYHDTQATIELELLQFAYSIHPYCHHYHLVSGACIPIKLPSVFLGPFLPPTLSHLCIDQYDNTIYSIAKVLGIKWYNTPQFGHSHFQFWILNNKHADLLTRLINDKDDENDYLNDLIKIQRECFRLKMPHIYSYDDLINSSFNQSAYNIKLTSPCEWFIFPLLAQAVRKYTTVKNISHIKSKQINVTHGIYQHHFRHGVDHHPIEFPDLDTQVNVLCNDSISRKGKKKTKISTITKASLREILSEDIVSASTVVAQPLALWDDNSVLIVRKISNKPLDEDTWRSE
jgi:hypothetical protein